MADATIGFAVERLSYFLTDQVKKRTKKWFKVAQRGIGLPPVLYRFSVLKEDHAASKRGALDRVQNLCKKEANLYRIDVVGFEDAVKTLLDEILREDPSLKVISIHGMGGLGKTTLLEYNIKDVLKRIIKSFVRHDLDLSNLDEIDLLQHLRKLLEDRGRYVAVIDDVWEKMKQAFPDKKNGSRVVVTVFTKI
ncbi:hypothetical protein AgCh_009798 [Apium graveolens]